MKYTPVIGLEIHAELLTETKVFCACKNSFGGSVNERVCPVCSAMPGTLPTINKQAILLAARAGFALDCNVNSYSAFDRKNYFYPDLPKAYQITQARFPICTDGYVDIENKRIRINRIHIEEDAGKLIHDEENNISMADYNRCGVPLIEIVTEPDFRSAKEVSEFVEAVALRLKYAHVCDARMEQGSLRVDVNISIMPEGTEVFGTRAEIKNLNSVKAIVRAIEYEILRQSSILDSGLKVEQETRRFNDSTGETSALRSKEEAHDYRYFPEPDIPPVFIGNEEKEEIRKNMPEMPHKRFLRYTEEYGLPKDDANLIIAREDFSDLYDETVRLLPSYKQIANLMIVELNRCLNESNISLNELKFTPYELASLQKMCNSGTITKNSARKILAIMFETGRKPEEIAETEQLIVSEDTSELEITVDEVLKENPDAITDYNNGNSKIFAYLMGQISRRAKKGSNMALVKDLLTEKLNK